MSVRRLEPIGLSTILIALVISALWGGNVVSIRVGVDTVPPLWSAFWRMLAGVIFVSVWAWVQGISIRPAPGETKPLLVLGVMFTIQIAMLNSGSALTSPAYAVVLLNGYPIFVNITAHIVAHYWKGIIHEESITPVRALGLLLAVGGIVWLALGKPDKALAPRPLLGNLLIVGSSVLLGVRQVYTRWLVQTIDPVRSVTWQMLLSVPLFFLIAVVSEPLLIAPLSWQPVFAICYQGFVVAGLCFVVWARLLQRHSAGTLSMFSFLVPICGIALSTWIFGESLQSTLFAATALVLCGLLVVIKFGQSD